MTRSKHKKRRERGAVAVEFALVAPILLLIVVAIVEFSHAYNLQISVTQAAREAARSMAIHNNASQASAAGAAGAPGVPLSSGNFSYSTGGCNTAGSTVTATVAYNTASLTGFFGSTVSVTGKAAMQCGG